MKKTNRNRAEKAPSKRTDSRRCAVAMGSAKHTRWEYMTDTTTSGYMNRQRLEELGHNGWEMCGTVATVEGPSTMDSMWPGVVCFYFKRPLPNIKDLTRGDQP